MQTTRSISITAALVLAMFALSGCSFLVTSGPDSTTVQQTCVTSKAPVVIDVATAVLLGSMSLAAFGAVGNAGEEGGLVALMATGTLVPMGVSIGSAVYGNRKTNRCSAATSDATRAGSRGARRARSAPAAPVPR